MEDPEARLRIAVTLNKSSNVWFVKVSPRPKRKKHSLVTRTLDQLADRFIGADAVRLGWMTREFERAIEYGLIRHAD